MDPKTNIFRRPRVGDTEEDILAMQQAFLAEKEKNRSLTSSAKVVNVRKHKVEDSAGPSEVKNETSVPIKQSKYARDKKLAPKPKVTFDPTTTVLGDIKEKTFDDKLKDEVADDPIYYPTVIPSLLGEIIEKNINHFEEFKPNLPKINVPHHGFPIATKDNISFKSKQVKSSMESISGSTEQKNNVNFGSFGEHSAVLSGKEAHEIHERNTNMLANITEQEILEEKEKLAATIDPKLLAYIKSLRQKNQIPPTEQKPKTESAPKPMDVEPTTTDYDNEVILHPKLNNWIHFDTLEREKLEWMKSMDEVSVVEDKSYEARFDFKGRLLPYIMDYTEETKTLFHHGEEPHRPGYALTELFELCRSTVTQQRSLALNTIAGILEYYSAGRYNDAISLPISKIFFVLRFALDENIPIVLEPCLKALRNLFYNQIDECLLDFCLGTNLGLIQPVLISHKTETEDIDCEKSEIKDFHMAELDLINGCLRTNIFTRFRYILTVLKPNFSCVNYCLQVLIRFARCNDEVVENFAKTEELLNFIVENYLPLNHSSISQFKNDTERCKIVLETLKLIRILIGHSKSYAEIFVAKLNILDSLKSYCGNIITENVLLMKIQIETYYTWSSLLWHGYGLEELNDLKFILLRVLDNHSRGTDVFIKFPVIMHSHATALISLLHFSSSEVRKNFPTARLDIPSPIILAAKKWSSQISNLDEFTSGHLSSLSATLLYLSDEFASKTLKTEMEEINNCLVKMIKSKGFEKILNHTKRSSNLLCELKVDEAIKQSNNPCLYSIMFSNKSELPPTMNVHSPFPILASLSKYILSVKSNELFSAFICNSKIVEYLTSVSNCQCLSLTDNWFTRMEIITILNILECVIEFSCPDDQKELFYNMAFKLSYIVSPEFKSQLVLIMDKIIFSEDWFSTDRLLKNLSISNADSILKTLPEIQKCYKKALKLDDCNVQSNLKESKWEMTILPRDWMFMPIVGIYSKTQEKEALNLRKEVAEQIEENIKNIIVCSLKWILISEIYFPEVTAEISLTDRFCRLSCVFLCSNSVFLDKEVQTLLGQCFKLIYNLERTSKKAKLDFDAPLIGINSFSELYTQLVDQFQAVSYGDPAFASCVLVPLAQCHSINWKKIVWSEYASCLRALDCPIEDLCYNIESYLNPPELDFSLLKCYHRALNSNLLRKNTVPYKIAEHHVECAKLRQKSKKMSS